MRASATGIAVVAGLSVYLALGAGPRLQAGGVIDLGTSDEFTLSQPIVQVQIGSFDTLLNEYLLDTGASGILVGASASQELTGAGLQTVATYTDFGVAGEETTQVSAPYDFHYAGANGVPLTLPGTRIQTSGGDFAFYAGIAGMPLMMNRTVGLDLAAQADMNALRIGVAFGSGPPPTAARQYTVPLTMVEFPATGQQHPGDPLPVSAPLPFLPVQVRAGTHALSGNFLLDTGAQQCILSSQAAFDLGLDANGNGTFDDEAASFQTVAGVGGSVQIPVLSVDSLALRATGGFDLAFGGISVGIIDIDPSISGVLGMNVLNTGWEMYQLNTFLGNPPGPPGVFDRVDLDFRTAAATMQGELRLTVNADRMATSAWQVAAGSTLTLGPQVPATVQSLAIQGLLDVGTGMLTVASGLSPESLVQQITAGLAGGASGISSSAAATSGGSFTVGWLDNGDGSVTFGYAAAGDSNLDGVVDLTDLLATVGGGKYDTGVTSSWADGDSNYDGIVDLSDLLQLVGGGQYDRPVLAGGGSNAPGLSSGSITAVPEPSAWIPLAGGAVLLALRRKRA